MPVIRKTKTVELLINFFNNNDKPISILELADQFVGVMDKSTVYRILERLEDSNILHSFIGHDGVKRYAKYKKQSLDNNAEVHPHFLCKNCGVSSCLPITIPIPSVPNYIIDSAEHLLTGQCKDCLT